MKSSRPDHAVLRFLLLLLLGAAVLLWPAFVSRQPFLFDDTTAYVRGADAAVMTLVGNRSEWSNEVSGPPSKPVPLRPVLAGRSIYYGAPLWLSQALGSFWWMALAQALLVSASVTLAVRRMGPPGLRRSGLPAVAILILLAIASPVAFFSSFAMPDIFAPLAVLGAAALAVGRRPIPIAERLFWFALLTGACLFHSANILIIGGLAVVMLTARWFRLAPIDARGVALAAAAVAVGLVGEMAFNFAIQRTLGTPPIRPPFLMARMIDDGPGYSHLRENCATRPAPYEVCRFLPILPQLSDTFLWSPDPREGVFMVAAPAVQRALSEEQFRFAGDVLLNRPGEQILASLAAAGRQAVMIGLPEFNYNSGTRDGLSRRLPPAEVDKQRNTLAFEGHMPTALPELLTYASLLASIIVLALGRRWLFDRNTGRLSSLGGVTFVILAGLTINALVCGAMSTPHDRYAARMIWLLPLVASMLVAGFLAERRNRRASDAVKVTETVRHITAPA